MSNKKLQQIILKMIECDQNMRQGQQYDQKVDTDNTNQLKKIIQQYGWPTISIVGEKAAKGAWLLAQHADHDVPFQKQCLKLIKEAVKNREADSKCIPYLTDRILTNQNKPQLFGTQFKVTKHGKLIAKNIKDRKNLNKKRKNFGLGSFEEYRQQLIHEHKKLH